MPKAELQLSRREAIRLNREGPEVPDPTPIEIPAQHHRPESLTNQMRRLIRQELSQAAQAEGQESFDEFDDLDVDEDEPDLTTPYTVIEMRDEDPSLLLEPENGSEDPTGHVETVSGPEGTAEPPAPPPASVKSTDNVEDQEKGAT